MSIGQSIEKAADGTMIQTRQYRAIGFNRNEKAGSHPTLPCTP